MEWCTMSRRWSFLASALLAIVMATAGSGRAFGGLVGYGVDTSENLYSINLGTAAATLIGSTGAFLEGVALSPGGSLYGTDDGGNLYSINLSTGAATLIGSTGLGDVEGLKFSGSTLLGTNFTSPTTIYTIDTSTAGVTPLGTTDPAQGVTRAFALEGSNTGLIVTDSPAFQTLNSVDLTTGATTTLGFLGSNGIYGIDFAGKVLYGLGNGGAVYTIDPTTGATTLVGTTGSQFWLDLAIGNAATVPEPSTFVLAVSVVLFAGMVQGVRSGRRFAQRLCGKE